MDAPARPLVFHPKADSELAARLRGVVRGELLFDRASRGRYSTDASIYQVEPIGVLVPRSHDDVRAAVDVCRELGVPLLPRGAGSSQCGQTVGAALVIDHSKHLTGVIAFDHAAMTVTVEPGIVLDALNAWLRPHGVWFPVDVSTSAQATLGGMAGNDSCGSLDRVRQHGAQRAGGRCSARRRHRGVAGRRGEDGQRATTGRGARRRAARDRRARARRDRAPRAEGDAPCRGLQPRRLSPAERTSLHGGPQRQSRTTAGGQRGNAGMDPHADAEARAAAEAPRSRHRQLSDAVSRDGAGAAHRRARPIGCRARRPHDDRTRTRQSGVPSDHRQRAGRRARCDPARGIHGRGRRGAASPARGAGATDG